MRAFWLAALLFCCVIRPQSAEAQTTALSLYSETGHIQTWTSPQVQFTYESVGATRSHFVVYVWDGTRMRRFRFLASIARPLAPGVYENTFSDRSEFGSWPELEADGCTRYGRFQIYEINTNPDNGPIRFAADFQYRGCFATTTTFGALRYNAVRSSLIPFDGAFPARSLHIEATPHGRVTGSGIDCGAGLTDCDETYQSDAFETLQATASPGYVFLGWVGPCAGDTTAVVSVVTRQFCAPVFHPAPNPDSDHFPEAFATAAYLVGPYGPGGPTPKSRAFLPGPPGSSMMSLVKPSTGFQQTRSRVRFGIEGSGVGLHVNAEFRTTNGASLNPGTYDSTAPSPTLILTSPGYTDCSTGTFTIYEFEYDTVRSQIVRFAADFSMTCPAGAVTGSLRYRSTRMFLLPYATAPTTPLVLTVISTGGGIVTGAGIACGDGGNTDCSESLENADTVTLQAAASPGYQFVGWTGDCTGDEASTTVMVDRRARCYAVFTPVPGSGAPADPTLGMATFVLEELIPAAGAQRTVVRETADLMTITSTPNPNRSVTVTAGDLTLTIRVPHPAPFIGQHEEERPDPSGVGILSLVGCEQPLARVYVYEAAFVNDVLFSFAADFEARCVTLGVPPRHVVGAVRYQSARSALVPFEGSYPFHKLAITRSQGGVVIGDGIDCGPGRSPCARTFGGPFTATLRAIPVAGYKFIAWAGACSGGSVTTVSGEWLRRCEAVFSPLVAQFAYNDLRSVLFFDSEPGEPVGQGTRQAWIEAPAKVEMTGSAADAARVTVTHSDGAMWFIHLQAPPGQDLVAGTYPNASDARFAASGPTMLISSSRGGCSTPVTGRFVIYQYRYFVESGTASHFAADFEQRCSPDGPLLRGSIRVQGNGWRALAPFTPVTLTDLVANRPVLPPQQGGPALFWRHLTTGTNALWQMNGGAAGVTTQLVPAGAQRVSDPEWTIRAAADFNHDGSPDLIWQHNTSGRLAIWYMAGPTLVSSDSIYDAAGSAVETNLDWKIVAAGDTDLDGYPDLVWRHGVTGAIRLWHMRGNREWDTVGFGRVEDADWKIVGLADMDDDGLLDLVWWHRTRGVIAAWFMWDTYVRTTRSASHALPDTNWNLVGLTDLNGDKRPDLLWQNTATGALGVWFMNGLTQIGGRHLEPSRVADLNWRIHAVR